MTPQVSVILPIYNAWPFLKESVHSVLNQSYSDWELIAIDDGSTDSGAAWIRKLAESEPRIQVVGLPQNSGTAYARNQGIVRARGRFLAFLDSDDIWHRDKLSVQTQWMIDQEASFTFTSYRRLDEHNRDRGVVNAPHAVSYTQILKGNPIGCSTVILDASRLGPLQMPSLRLRQDYALWLQLLRDGHTALGIDSVFTTYRVRSDSLSANKLRAARYQWNVYRNEEKLGRLYSLYCFAHYAIHGARRRVSNPTVSAPSQKL